MSLRNCLEIFIFERLALGLSDFKLMCIRKPYGLVCSVLYLLRCEKWFLIGREHEELPEIPLVANLSLMLVIKAHSFMDSTRFGVFN